MLNRRDFDLSLRAGQIAEAEIRELLTAWSLEPGPVLIEVKRDELVHRTGNLFIEYSSRGAVSGIDCSKANWFAFSSSGHNGRLIVFAERLYLKRRLEQLRREGRLKLSAGGDNNTSVGYLVNVGNLFVI